MVSNALNHQLHIIDTHDEQVQTPPSQFQIQPIKLMSHSELAPIFRISHNQHPQTEKSAHLFCYYSHASMALHFFQDRFTVFHPSTICDDGWKLTWRHFSIGSVQSWEFYYIEDKGLGRKRETVKGKLGCWGWNWSTPTHTLIQSIAFIWTQH